jgi:hypothetical protein
MNRDKPSAEIMQDMIERLILMGQRGAIRKMQESIHCTVGVQEDIVAQQGDLRIAARSSNFLVWSSTESQKTEN